MTDAKKPQVIGFWYRPLMHFALGQGPHDAFLEFRGGDRTAWKGEQTASGEIYVDAMNLWGGEKSEGGIAGKCDILMGDPAQEPSAYLTEKLGPMQPAWRGIATFLFKGGRYGAMNPYPKPASFKVRRILRGWDNTTGDDSEGECWYPERAPIPMDIGEDAPPAWLGEGFVVSYVGTRVNVTDPVLGFNEFTWAMANQYGLAYDPVTTSSERLFFWRRNESGLIYSKREEGTDFDQDMLANLRARGLEPNQTALVRFWSVTGLHMVVHTLGATSEAPPAPEGYSWIEAGSSPFSLSGVGAVRLWYSSEFLRRTAPTFFAMNPAHILLDSLIADSMQGEPIETVNLASFAAAADTLYDEGFGLCTKYNVDRETVEEFRQRICNIIGARCSRSRVDGLWYLDLIRDDYDLESLPILLDDDILEFEEEPSTLDDTVNQVSVQWFDPQIKEARATAPVEAQGAIQAVGAVNAETIQFPEIPLETLALRVAQRELEAKAQLPKRFRLVCNRTPYAWRIGRRFRLQTTRRGIADMVCMVGDIDTGTLRSGAIRLVAVQDVYSMPDTAYIVPQVPVDPDDAPRGSPQQRLTELPYVELVATRSHADMAALPQGIGYIGAMATMPTVGYDYSLYTHGEGEEFGEGSIGSWCPAFVLEEAAGYLDTEFTLAAGSRLALLEVGQRLLWELEEVRLVAFDAVAGTVTLARGVADTVPSRHAAGTVLYGYDQWHALDGREYADGEVVTAKLLTRTATRVQDPDEAPTLTVEIAARPYRPYPPAGLTINGSGDPSYLYGTLTLGYAHRDRILQADQLVDQAAASIGPEAGTTYTVRCYLDGVLDDTQTGITGTAPTVEPSGDGMVRIEVESVRDGLTSFQMQVREFAYTVAPATPWELQGTGVLQGQSGTTIFLMG